ncbi:hypothetical protein V1523DRAFT_415006 [Lipomyces doorenjongii]
MLPLDILLAILAGFRSAYCYLCVIRSIRSKIMVHARTHATSANQIVAPDEHTIKIWLICSLTCVDQEKLKLTVWGRIHSLKLMDVWHLTSREGFRMKC